LSEYEGKGGDPLEIKIGVGVGDQKLQANRGKIKNELKKTIGGRYMQRGPGGKTGIFHDRGENFNRKVNKFFQTKQGTKTKNSGKKNEQKKGEQKTT